MEIYNTKGTRLIEIKGDKFWGDANLIEVDERDLSSCELANGVFENIIFSLGSFDETHINRGRLRNVKFVGTWMCDVDLTEATFDIAEFYDVQAYGAKLAKSALKNVRFVGANLSDVDFSNAIFESVFFGKDNVGHETDISGANLSGVDLKNTTFDGVIYDESTQFPADFNPHSHGGLTKRT